MPGQGRVHRHFRGFPVRLLRRPSHASIVAYLALFVAATGTATAATGGSFLLGKSNSANHATA